MTTLIVVGNSEGERRCDAKCYEASSPECECICGGKNHGVGKKQAQENTRQLAEELVRKFKELGEELRILPQLLPLFEEV